MTQEQEEAMGRKWVEWNTQWKLIWVRYLTKWVGYNPKPVQAVSIHITQPHQNLVYEVKLQHTISGRLFKSNSSKVWYSLPKKHIQQEFMEKSKTIFLFQNWVLIKKAPLLRAKHILEIIFKLSSLALFAFWSIPCLWASFFVFGHITEIFLVMFFVYIFRYCE